MDSKHTITKNRSNERITLENKQTQLLEAAAESRHRAMVSAWVAATIVALVATVTLLESCGSNNSSIKPASSTQQSTVAPQQNVVASTDGLQGTVSSSLPPQIESSDELKSVPPDAVVAVSDTFVTAGQPIEVVVQGTPDVTEMALADGRGDALPMVRDSSSDVWRVNYRVPLRPKTDRLGLSVTAKNESNRWRRVWVFLQVDDGKQQVETTSPEQLEPDHK